MYAVTQATHNSPNRRAAKTDADVQQTRVDSSSIFPHKWLDSIQHCIVTVTGRLIRQQN